MIIQRCVIAFSDALSPFKWAHILIQTPDLFEAERESRCVPRFIKRSARKKAYLRHALHAGDRHQTLSFTARGAARRCRDPRSIVIFSAYPALPEMCANTLALVT